jgi:hypothetical protein
VQSRASSRARRDGGRDPWVERGRGLGEAAVSRLAAAGRRPWMGRRRAAVGGAAGVGGRGRRSPFKVAVPPSRSVTAETLVEPNKESTGDSDGTRAAAESGPAKASRRRGDLPAAGAEQHQARHGPADHERSAGPCADVGVRAPA